MDATAIQIIIFKQKTTKGNPKTSETGNGNYASTTTEHKIKSTDVKILISVS